MSLNFTLVETRLPVMPLVAWSTGTPSIASATRRVMPSVTGASTVRTKVVCVGCIALRTAFGASCSAPIGITIAP